MTEKPTKPKIEKLDLTPETVTELSKGEAEGAKGGAMAREHALSGGNCRIIPTRVCATDLC